MFFDPAGLPSTFPQLTRSVGGWSWLTVDEFGPRLEFLMRPDDVRPILYYEHFRGIAPIPSHRGRFVAVEDHACSNCLATYRIDLDTLARTRLDGDALVAVNRAVGIEFGADATLAEWSPDDTQLLLRIGFDGGHMTHRDREVLLNRDSRNSWWVAVDAETGQVRSMTESAVPPPRWWTLPTTRKN